MWAGVVALTAAVALALPVVGWAAGQLPDPDYEWYTNNTDGDNYVIADRGDFVGFINLVNGTADYDDANEGTDAAVSFEGKTVTLGSGLYFSGAMLDPIGSGDNMFNGTFDGGGKAITNYTLNVNDAKQNIGLFGKAGAASTIKNLTVDNATVSVAVTSAIDGDSAQAKNIGALVGYSAGKVQGCAIGENVTVTVTTDVAAQQSGDKFLFSAMNVGSGIGLCLGDVTDSTNKGSVSVTNAAKGNRVYDADGATMLNIGGVVGSVGGTQVFKNMDGVDEDATEQHGNISGCSNYGEVRVSGTAAGVGGVAGYSRGSVSSCSNYGYVYAPDASVQVGGVAGSVRAELYYVWEVDDNDPPNYNLSVTDCLNQGDVVAGEGEVGGIAGQAYYWVNFTGCVNGFPNSDTQNWVVHCISFGKLGGGGIVGRAQNSVVSFCANYGYVQNGVWDDATRTLTKNRSGGYIGGLVGKSYDNILEIHSCINTGELGGSRDDTRHLAGYVEGAGGDSLHDNFFLDGVADSLAYAGLVGINLEVDQSVLVNNEGIESLDGKTPLEVMNALSSKNDYKYYWLCTGEGFPILNTFASDLETVDLGTQTVAVQQSENGWAPYTGKPGSDPEMAVVIGEGESAKTLKQYVDYYVVPQDDAVEMTFDKEDDAATDVDESKPYTATIVGMGRYSGTATGSYGIGQLNLSACTVEVTPVQYDRADHAATALTGDTVTVKDQKGTEISSDWYTFSFATSGEEGYLVNHSDGKSLGTTQAVDSYTYRVVVTANEESGMSFGQTQGGFTITPAPLSWDDDESTSNATFTKIKGAGYEYGWVSSRENDADEDIDAEFPYTGYPIYPEVEGEYLGEPLSISWLSGPDASSGLLRTWSSDVSLMNRLKIQNAYLQYQGNPNTGTPDNTGSAEAITYASVYVNSYTESSNFSSGDGMRYAINPNLTPDLADAVVTLEAYEFSFQEGGVYEPVVTVTYLGSRLTEGTDYEVAYEDNKAVGKAKAIVTAIGDVFEGTQTVEFDILSSEELPLYELTYAFTASNGTAAVTGLTYYGAGIAYDIVVPETVVGEDGASYTVTSVGTNAFGSSNQNHFNPEHANFDKKLYYIKSVQLPNTVTTIGNSAFVRGGKTSAYPGLLESVTFADPAESKLTRIEYQAFAGAAKLKSFVIPAGVTFIERYAFAFPTGNALRELTFLAVNPSAKISYFFDWSPVFQQSTFSGVGSGLPEGEKVKVYGYNSATVAQNFASNNAGASAGSYGACNCEFVSLGDAKVTVSFVAGSDAVTGSMPEPLEMVVGTTLENAIPALPEGTVNEGHAFTGWLAADGSDATMYQPGDAYTVAYADVTLAAQWNYQLSAEAGKLVVSVQVGDSSDSDVQEGDEPVATTYGAEVPATMKAELPETYAAMGPTYQWYKTAAPNLAGTSLDGQASSECVVSAETMKALDAGTHYYYCVIGVNLAAADADEPEYAYLTTQIVSIRVEQADASVAWKTADQLTVTATPKSVAIAGAEGAPVSYVGDGALKYALVKPDANGNSTAPALDSSEWKDAASFAELEANTLYHAYAMIDGSGANYKAAVSGAFAVQTREKDVFESPVVNEMTYDAQRTLGEVSLPSGWTWDDPTAVPEVGNAGYAATYTISADTAIDFVNSDIEGFDAETNTVKRTLVVPLVKGTPVVEENPLAELTVGQTLAQAQISGGKAIHTANNRTSDVEGTFAWLNGTLAPTLADSEATEYAAVFYPDDADNYNAVNLTLTVKVSKMALSEDNVVVSVSEQTYTGEPIEPELVVTANGIELEYGEDYTVEFSNNTEEGTANYVITFAGNYEGQVAGTFQIAAEGSDVLLGDVNGDDKVNSTDAVLVLHYSVGKTISVNFDVAAADVNGDDKVNSTDAVLILHYSVGKITAFPVASR